MPRLRHGHWKLLKLQLRLSRRPPQLKPRNPGTIRGSTPGLNPKGLRLRDLRSQSVVRDREAVETDVLPDEPLEAAGGIEPPSGALQAPSFRPYIQFRVLIVSGQKAE